LMSLEPAVAALAGMLVLSQQPRLRTVAAIILVVVASAGTTIGASRSASGRAGGNLPAGDLPAGDVAAGDVAADDLAVLD
ncbi:MAG TPA: hypothetical protein VGX49_01655, partial [Jatrophihabitans sp.]|nr:hypothetical protein [Jatrophihabitans sp.]